jgi:hypothetical protein
VLHEHATDSTFQQFACRCFVHVVLTYQHHHCLSLILLDYPLMDLLCLYNTNTQDVMMYIMSEIVSGLWTVAVRSAYVSLMYCYHNKQLTPGLCRLLSEEPLATTLSYSNSVSSSQTLLSTEPNDVPDPPPCMTSP